MPRHEILSVPMDLQSKELSFESSKCGTRDGVLACAGGRALCWRPTREEAEAEAKHYLRTGRFMGTPEEVQVPRGGNVLMF